MPFPDRHPLRKVLDRLESEQRHLDVLYEVELDADIAIGEHRRGLSISRVAFDHRHRDRLIEKPQVVRGGSAHCRSPYDDDVVTVCCQAEA